MREFVPSLFPGERACDDVINFSFVFNNSEEQSCFPFEVDQLTHGAVASTLCQSFFNDLVFVFSFLSFELLSEVNLILCLKHEILVTTDNFVFEFVEIFTYHGEVVRYCVVVRLVISVCFF